MCGKTEVVWKRGRPKRRFMDVVKQDMAVVEVTEEDVYKIGPNGDGKSAVVTPDGRSRKKKDDSDIDETANQRESGWLWTHTSCHHCLSLLVSRSLQASPRNASLK